MATINLTYISANDLPSFQAFDKKAFKAGIAVIKRYRPMLQHLTLSALRNLESGNADYAQELSDTLGQTVDGNTFRAYISFHVWNGKDIPLTKAGRFSGAGLKGKIFVETAPQAGKFWLWKDESKVSSIANQPVDKQVAPDPKERDTKESRQARQTGTSSEKKDDKKAKKPMTAKQKQAAKDERIQSFVASMLGEFLTVDDFIDRMRKEWAIAEAASKKAA